MLGSPRAASPPLPLPRTYSRSPSLLPSARTHSLSRFASLSPSFSPSSCSACRPQSAAVNAHSAAQQGALHAVAVPDDAFAASVHRLLRDSKATPERLGLLAGVVSRQVAHAGERFSAGQQERGLASLSGALFLVRAGEFRTEMLGSGVPALSSAISLVAPRGDEGRSIALLTMQSALMAPGTPARRENDEHLAALRTWMKDTRKSGSLESLGAEQRVQALRSLVEPSAESLSTAREATVRWIDQSFHMTEDRKSRIGATASRRRARSVSRVSLRARSRSSHFTCATVTPRALSPISIARRRCARSLRLHSTSDWSAPRTAATRARGKTFSFGSGTPSAKTAPLPREPKEIQSSPSTPTS